MYVWQYARGRYVRQLPSSRRRALNISTFFTRGTYTVTYPKTASSTSTSTAPSCHTKHPTSQANPTQAPGAVMKMLTFIDQKLNKVKTPDSGNLEERESLLRAYDKVYAI